MILPSRFQAEYVRQNHINLVSESWFASFHSQVPTLIEVSNVSSVFGHNE